MTKSRTLEIYQQLRSDIVGVRHAPGARLRIESLCGELDASLGAVREALSRLSSEGLVVAQPQRGFIVAPVSIDDLRDLTEVRVTVEGICLARSIERGDAGWESRVRDTWAELSSIPIFIEDEDGRLGAAWNAAHGRFHAALASACGSAWWLRFREQLFDQSERYRQLSAPLGQHDRDVAREHEDIVGASLARDAVLAVERLQAHLRKTTDILLSRSLLRQPDAGDGDDLTTS